MPHNGSTKSCKSKRRLWVLGLLAIGSAIWFLFRTGKKPSRIYYPCQQAALTNIEVFKIAFLASVPSLASIRSTLSPLKPVGILAVLFVGSVFVTSDTGMQALGFTLAQDNVDYDWIPIDLEENVATSEEASDIFLVQNVTGAEGNVSLAISTLLDMMESEELYFYNTTSTPDGLIEADDVVLLKVNGQWAYRGGTNTDLLKAVIEIITSHPEGFTGEIIIADNGQDLGSLDRSESNAFNTSQAMEDVAQMFPGHTVSTILWDDYRSSTVEDYDSGDFNEGYVRSSVWDSDTEIYPSHAKFVTDSGLYVSFKNGIWTNESGFDSNRLKVINMPVLKTHFRYGVSGCIKHYMGVPQGYIVPSVDRFIPHEHFSIALGGMATLMVETRMPILNILDMIWVNANPLESSSTRGPWSYYTTASFTDIIGMSQDPVALDYWASKNILVPTAEYLGYDECSSLDPDYAPLSDQFFGATPMDESFHNYLNRSRQVLVDAGYRATMDTAEMNVFVQTLSGTGPPPTPTTSATFDPTLIVVGIPVTILFVVLAAFMLKRRR
ncbi:MAG: DUF362 domain-containing protein [Candidatus Thorarchaeota archaeon]